jgi:hypothetical protein
MPGLHKAPFENPKVEANLSKLVPLQEGERYVAYYDATMLSRATAGMLLTTRRLVKFNKRKISALMLQELEALSHKKAMGVHYLTAASAESILEQAFQDRSMLDDFQAEISKRTDVGLSSSIVGIAQALKAEVFNAGTRARLEKIVPLRDGEDYLACVALSGLLLTSHRVLKFTGRSVTWSVDLDDLYSVAFERTIAGHHELRIVGGGRRHKVDLFGGEAAAVCRAIGYLIAEAQGLEAGSLDGIHIAGTSLVAVPSHPDYFEFEEQSVADGKACLVVKAAFPPACAWCRSPEVACSREILLDGTIQYKQSAGKKVAAVLIAGPLAGSIIGADRTFKGPFKLVLSACEDHQDTAAPPRLNLHSTLQWWEGGVCLLDLRDTRYAEEFCRCNRL